eukprot:1219820-Amphidinium_carterae.2
MQFHWWIGGHPIVKTAELLRSRCHVRLVAVVAAETALQTRSATKSAQVSHTVSPMSQTVLRHVKLQAGTVAS